jgi:hypothetical protein
MHASENCCKFLPSCALFRIAVDEIESWFIADSQAIGQAYPRANLSLLNRIKPDGFNGSSELLARVLGKKPEKCSRTDKREWAINIAPHLDLDDPKSPGLGAFIKGIDKLIGTPTK